MKAKDKDIIFIKGKYEEANVLWHKENLEKQKMQLQLDNQFREAMELDTLRRRADDEKNTLRKKNNDFKLEIEELIKENQKLT